MLLNKTKKKLTTRSYDIIGIALALVTNRKEFPAHKGHVQTIQGLAELGAADDVDHVLHSRVPLWQKLSQPLRHILRSRNQKLRQGLRIQNVTQRRSSYSINKKGRRESLSLDSF